MDFFRIINLRLHHAVAQLFIELPARRLGINGLISRLEKSGSKLEKRLTTARARQENQAIVTHMIGIERWGLRRIGVVLGEPAVDEGYDDYCPADRDWSQLLASLRSARLATIAMGKTIRMAGVDSNTRVMHNQFGEISLLGWLYYLELHASWESMRIS